MKYYIAVRIKKLSVSTWVNINNIQGKKQIAKPV